MESTLVYYLGIGAIILVMAVGGHSDKVTDSGIAGYLTALIFVTLWPLIVIQAIVMTIVKIKRYL